MNAKEIETHHLVPAADLAGLGTGTWGYIREIGPGHAAKLLGPRISVPDNIKLFCLYGADGTPVSISGSFEAAFVAAREHELTPVAVH
ncbi:hypothetical protein BH10PSE7_BH10PSE7_27950 [soil metagenome]